MTVYFSDEEKEWLVKEPFNWRVADNAPYKIRKSIERKLEAINRQASDNKKAR